jgi:Right handed beta helix region
MNRVTYLRKFATFLVFVSAFCSHAQATNLKVNCDGTGALSTINGALNLLNPQGPNTVTVSGACHENIVIQSFDRLTLIASPGASITDASGRNDFVILIIDSQRISIQGFTVSGGAGGIGCSGHSLCRFSGNTIQDSAGDGVAIARSVAVFDGDIIQNNPNGRGLVITQAGEVNSFGATIQGNGTSGGEVGIRVIEGSFLHADGTTVRGNGGDGIGLAIGSTMRGENNTITGNGRAGVAVSGGSTARLITGNVVTGNAGNGVSLSDLSFALFELRDNNISANTTQPDVVCNPQFSATRGTKTNIGGGTTNCIEP